MNDRRLVEMRVLGQESRLGQDAGTIWHLYQISRHEAGWSGDSVELQETLVGKREVRSQERAQESIALSHDVGGKPASFLQHRAGECRTPEGESLLVLRLFLEPGNP